tara:strand:+ start:822 stop:1904 length:1083 start_codon:yes stop_codon:yes gene_type:complete
MKKKRKKRKIRKKPRTQRRKHRIFRKAKKSFKIRKKSQKTKKLKKSLKKTVLVTLAKTIKPNLKFSFNSLFKKIISPLIKVFKNLKKSKERLELKKKQEAERGIKLQSSLRKELLKKEIKEEKALAKTRAAELKSFLRDEQKAIREKEKEKQRKFLEEVKLEKTLERFRDRENEEIKAIEKYTLNIEREDYKAFQQRIDQVREKYRALRNERLRKRVEELGVTLSDQASVEEIRQKEKEYLERRELIETSLESFTRSAISLVYQINKRYLPRNADLIRVINLVYEQSEIIIREDQEQNENFLILIYVKDQDAKKEIIVEDKIKQETREYNRNSIFKFGDDLTDSLILYLERIRERMKKAS